MKLRQREHAFEKDITLNGDNRLYAQIVCCSINDGLPPSLILPSLSIPVFHVYIRDPGPGVSPHEAFKICPYWIPPSTFTAVVIASNASYVRVEYANYVATENINHNNRY